MSLEGPNSEIESRQVLPSPLLKFGDTFEDLHDSYTDYITNCESPKGASEHFGPSQVGNARWCFEEGRSAEWSHSPIFAPSSTDRLTSQPLPTTCLRPFPAAVRNGLGAHNKVLRCSARETGALQRRLTSVLYLGPSNFFFPTHPHRHTLLFGIDSRSTSGSSRPLAFPFL